MSKFDVAKMVVDRLIDRIESEKKLPWQKPFTSACMNWYTHKEYMGTNKILLSGGEYITMNQLREYNEKNKTDYLVEKGTKSEIVIFYNKFDKKLTSEQVSKHKEKWGTYGLIQINGEWYKRSWFLKYYKVFNINFISNSKGEKLPSKIASGEVVEEHTPSDEIVKNYTQATGVRIRNSASGAYYNGATDSVYMQGKDTFKGTEAYYRVLFHELVHSTGIKTRLARSCYEKYHEGSVERSKEELVAEIGGLLLASEAGFRDDSQWVDNSLEYVAGWCAWMKENPNEVISGMTAAEKAKNYILTGGKVISSAGDKVIGSDYKSTDEPDAVAEETDSVDNAKEKDSKNEDSTSNSSENKEDDILVYLKGLDFSKIKTKKSVKEICIEGVFPVMQSGNTEFKDKALSLLKVVDIRQMYFILTKENLPKSIKKVDALERLVELMDKR